MIKGGESLKFGKSITYCICIILISSLLIFIPGEDVQGGPWTIEIVDWEGAQVGWDTSIAIDSLGKPHIAYFDETNDKLKYASWTGTQWINETIDVSISVGGYCSLALDSNDRPHISYDDEQNDDLRYAHWNGSAWTRQTVDSAGLLAHHTSIAVDSNDHPHISYHAWGVDDLKYAWWNGTSWNITTVDSSITTYTFSSIAMDSSDRPHISYVADGDLNYTWWDGFSWNFETVYTGGPSSITSIALDSGNNPHIGFHDSSDLIYTWKTGTWNFDTVEAWGYKASLVLDATDKPHMSFCNAMTQDLRYGSKTGASWNIQTVDAFGDVGKYASCALDASDNPHIAYFNNTIYPGDLKYANWTGSFWNIENIDFGNLDVGEYISMTLDSNYIPHISYKRRKVHNLRYANRTGGIWNFMTVANGGGSHTSIVLDTNDWPHISYVRNGSQHLKYAYWNGTDWNIQDVDTANDVGKYSSLALNESDYPRIGYYDEWNSRLKYAEWTGSTWTTTFVDSSGTVGGYVSMDLDSSYYPSISYYKATSGDLMCARWTGFTWSIQSVDSAGDVGKFTSIVIDDKDHPHISYYDNDNKTLKHAWWNGSAWSNEVVDSSNDVGQFSSIDVDTIGRPHISYYDATNKDLKFASLNGSWTYEVLDSEGDVGRYTSLEIDGGNTPHIAYFDVTRYEVKYTSGSLCSLPPDAPQNLAALSNVSQVSLSWGAPISDGGSPIIGYNIYRNDTAGIYSTVPPDQLWYNDTNVTKGIQYCYYISARNAVGEGLLSGGIIAVPGLVPSEPIGLNATPGNNYINLTWDPPLTDGGLPVLKYIIYRGTISGATSMFDIIGNITYYNDTAVSEGITYYYIVKAENIKGRGPSSNEVNASFVIITLPLAPLDLIASAGDAYIVLSWLPPQSDGGAPITSYLIYRSETPGDENFLIEIQDATSYNDTYVINGVTYFYKVSAKTDVGEGPLSEEVSAIPLGLPEAPRNLTATAENGYIILSWTNPLFDGGTPITNYRIYRGEAEGSEIFITEIGNNPFYNDTDVFNGIKYFYKITAVNEVGEGIASNQVNATWQNEPPSCAISSPITGVSVSGVIEILGTAFDGDGTVQWVEIRIDNGTWMKINETTSWSFEWNTTTYEDGAHLISVRSFDGFNFSSETSLDVIVKNQPMEEVKDEPEDNNWLWLLVAIVIVMIILIILMFLLKRRSWQEKEIEEISAKEEVPEPDSGELQDIERR